MEFIEPDKQTQEKIYDIIFNHFLYKKTLFENLSRFFLIFGISLICSAIYVYFWIYILLGIVFVCISTSLEMPKKLYESIIQCAKFHDYKFCKIDLAKCRIIFPENSNNVGKWVEIEGIKYRVIKPSEDISTNIYILQLEKERINGNDKEKENYSNFAICL